MRGATKQSHDLRSEMASLFREGGIARNEKTTPNCLTPFDFVVTYRLA
jgi:hypothetical protein